MNATSYSKINTFQPLGLATGIGSLPFSNPADALSLVMEELPEVPHWPQLPLRDKQEHFVHQFLQPLVACGMLVFRNQRWAFDRSSSTKAECLTRFYMNCLPAEEGQSECLRSFLPSPEAAAGFHSFLNLESNHLSKAQYLKGQIAGPLTIALELKDDEGRPAYYQGDLRDIIVRTLALNARTQADKLLQFGLTPIVFVDDPAVSAYGSRHHLALNREDILEDLNFLFKTINSTGAIAGIHSCEAVDWSLLMESQVQILSLDVYRFGKSLIPHKEDLIRFIENGGVVAWGIVPTLDDPFKESVESLKTRLFSLWNNLFNQGPSRESVIRQSMITPACGTGLLKKEQARRIYRLTAEVSKRLRKNVT
jgi:hypothetical protein